MASQTPLQRLGLQREREPIPVGARVTNGRQGASRVSGVVTAVDDDRVTVKMRDGREAIETRKNLMVIPCR
jgi:hypothetical protein